MVNPVFQTKQNDTSPGIEGTVVDYSGSVIDITGASAKFIMRSQENSSIIVNSSATVVSGTAGKVRYGWGTADTKDVGQYYAEFEITYSGGGVETFPNDGYISVEIDDDLG